MKITLEWLEQKKAREELIDWFKNQTETDAKEVILKLLKEDHFNWANWIIVQLMTRWQWLSYAVFSAKQVIDIYEKKYPNDNRARRAIEDADRCLKDPSLDISYSLCAADASFAADAAAIEGAAAAALAAYAASYAAYSASYTAADAVSAAACAVSASTSDEMRARIIEYGLKLIESESK